jgi:hypothetical protein
MSSAAQLRTCNGNRTAPAEVTAAEWNKPQLMKDIETGELVEGDAGKGRTFGSRLCTSSRPHWTSTETRRRAGEVATVGDRRLRAAQQRAAFFSISNMQQMAMETALEAIRFYENCACGCRRGIVRGSDRFALNRFTVSFLNELQHRGTLSRHNCDDALFQQHLCRSNSLAAGPLPHRCKWPRSVFSRGLPQLTSSNTLLRRHAHHLRARLAATPLRPRSVAAQPCRSCAVEWPGFLRHRPRARLLGVGRVGRGRSVQDELDKHC